MPRPQLLIGNKNYSSWSLRPWLLLKHFDVAFDEVGLPLDTPVFKARIGEWTPALRVPVLRVGAEFVWDSLAICETVNERWLDRAAWPVSASARAHARAIVCEMHAGFAAMRAELPMNVRRPPKKILCTAAAQLEIARVQRIWSECLRKHGGPWLFGAFSIADAFFAPVAWRFRGYDVELEPGASEVQSALLSHPAMQAWAADAASEREDLPQDEL